jgi:hypothetical protein
MEMELPLIQDRKYGIPTTRDEAVVERVGTRLPLGDWTPSEGLANLLEESEFNPGQWYTALKSYGSDASVELLHFCLEYDADDQDPNRFINALRDRRLIPDREQILNSIHLITLDAAQPESATVNTRVNVNLGYDINVYVGYEVGAVVVVVAAIALVIPVFPLGVPAPEQKIGYQRAAQAAYMVSGVGFARSVQNAMAAEFHSLVQHKEQFLGIQA